MKVSWTPIFAAVAAIGGAFVVVLIFLTLLKRWAKREDQQAPPLDLKALRRQGAISDEEYKVLRRKVAEQMRGKPSGTS